MIRYGTTLLFVDSGNLSFTYVAMIGLWQVGFTLNFVGAMVLSSRIAGCLLS